MLNACADSPVPDTHCHLCNPHLVACLDEVHLGHNLNGTLVDLGGNSKGLGAGAGSSSTEEGVSAFFLWATLQPSAVLI